MTILETSGTSWVFQQKKFSQSALLEIKILRYKGFPFGPCYYLHKNPSVTMPVIGKTRQQGGIMM